MKAVILAFPELRTAHAPAADTSQRALVVTLRDVRELQMLMQKRAAIRKADAIARQRARIFDGTPGDAA